MTSTPSTTSRPTSSEGAGPRGSCAQQACGLITHGALMLVCVALIPTVLNKIPHAELSAVKDGGSHGLDAASLDDAAEPG
jgi:hypothetical protein